MNVTPLLRPTLIGAAMTLWLCSACSWPAKVSTAGQGAAVVTQEGTTFTFESPADWVRQVQRSGTNEQFTMSTSRVSSFKFTLLKTPVDTQGVTLTLAELCTVQDKVRSEVATTGIYEKANATIDGRLCCAATYRDATLVIHLVTTYVEGNFYTFLYQYQPIPTLSAADQPVLAEMDRVLKSWHWKSAPPTPAPTPTPSPSRPPGATFFDNYFPVKDGWWWQYRVLLDGSSIGSLEVAASLKPVADGKQPSSIVLDKLWDVTGTVPGHERHETETFMTSLLGLNRTSGTPTSWLRPPYEAGHAWDVGDHHFVIESTAESVPTVMATLPNCLKAVETSPDGTTVSRWFSQELGLVQEITETAKHQKLSVILEDFEELSAIE